MLALLYLVGIGLVGFGVFAIAAPELMWRWQERQNELRGLVSRRTSSWNSGRIMLGLLLIGLGVVWLVVVITQVRPYL